MPEPGLVSRPVSQMTDDEIEAEILERRQRRATASTRAAGRKARKEVTPKEAEDSAEAKIEAMLAAQEAEEN